MVKESYIPASVLRRSSGWSWCSPAVNGLQRQGFFRNDVLVIERAYPNILDTINILKRLLDAESANGLMGEVAP